MDFLRLLHSWTRWGVVVVAVVALVWFILGLLQKREYDKNSQRLLTVFSSLVGVQWVLGILFLIEWGVRTSFSQRHLWEHAFVMTMALVVAHLHMMWKRKEMPDAQRFRNGLLVILGVLVVVVVGIAILPSAIQWRFYAG